MSNRSWRARERGNRGKSRPDAVTVHRHSPATLLPGKRRPRLPRFFSSRSITVTSTPTSDSMPVFEDGKLRPGIYKIMSIIGQTYVDIREHNRELCGRPTTVLEGKGLVGSYLRLAPIVVVMTILSGKFTL